MMTGMNTHFDITTDQGRKRAETLKALSLEPILNDARSPTPRLRRLILPACLLAAMLTVATGIALYRPAGALRELDRVAEDPAATSQKHGGETAKRTAAQNPTSAAREITGSGFVVAPQVTAVFAKYEGRITHIAVALGDTVEAGQTLAQLDDAGTRFALEQAEAAKAQAELNLAARRIDLAQARTRLERTETLAAHNATSRQALEDARAAVERASNARAQARLSIDTAALAVRVAQERMAELAVRAPFSGTVTRLDARVGDTVLARIDSVRENQSLFTMTDTGTLVIDADVAETSIADVRPGLRGEAVLDGFPDHPFAVTVLRLAPVASAEKGTITLRLSLDRPPDGIRPNMAARIRITLDETGKSGQ